MRTTFSVVNNNYTAGAGLSRIRSGDVFSFRIIENNHGLIKAVLKGQLFSVKGSPFLPSGTVLKVRAQWNGRSLVLNRIDDNSNSAKILSELGIKEDPAALSLFAAFRRAGGYLGKNNIEDIKRFLRHKKELDSGEARTAVEIIKKGISPEEMMFITDSRNGDNGENREKTILFNHIGDGNDLWYIVPFSFKTDDEPEEPFFGSLRIKKNLKSNDIQTVVIDVAADDDRFYFLIENYNSSQKRLRLFFEGKISESKKKYIKKRLPEILSNLSIKFDDNIKEDCFRDGGEGVFFDGFSSDNSIFSGIEEFI